MEVTFGQDHIRFLSYDFPGAAIHPTGTLTLAQIRDADWTTVPPEIRTTSGETLFISAIRRPELEHFCHHNGIARKHRPDTWADLLEPFLDTSFDPEHELATDNRLRQAGLSQEEVADIRQRLAPLMHAYNFDSMLWDWTHLSLCDLLAAASGPLVKPSLQATLGDPQRSTPGPWTSPNGTAEHACPGNTAKASA